MLYGVAWLWVVPTRMASQSGGSWCTCSADRWRMRWMRRRDCQVSQKVTLFTLLLLYSNNTHKLLVERTREGASAPIVATPQSQWEFDNHLKEEAQSS